MTDKQIINGVDVSECIECDIDKIKDGYDALCCLTNCSCKYHPNCYYKQLKRAEQKLEKIKEHLETVSYLAPVTTRVLKHSIKQIIEE